MKRNRMLRNMTSLLLVLALALGLTAGMAESEEEEFVWSDPGVYLTDTIREIKAIGNEEEAKAYAMELWDMVYGGQAPAGDDSMSVDLRDVSYHYGLIGDDGRDYSANFLSNGVVQAIWYSDNDERWYTEGQFTQPEPDSLDAETWEKTKAWLEELAEKLDPGVTELIYPMYIWQIRDVGDRKYLFISADAKADDCESGLNATVILFADGSCQVHEYSLYGQG